jgi:glycosyltransferase involved in cell wall biosynthesis
LMEDSSDFTVIIPHYRSFATLDGLLSTIPHGNSGVQIIVVDDHSGDHASLEKLQGKYRGVLFLTTRAGAKGAGAARNEALPHARGKWILFADADDRFLPGAFDIVRAHVNSDADIIFFKPKSVITGTSTPGTRHRRYEKLVGMHLDTRDQLIRYRFSVPWSKMIRHELVRDHNIRFSEVMASNDVMFSLMAGHFAKDIAASGESIYCVSEGGKSLTTNTSEAVFDSRFNVAIEYGRFLAQHVPHVPGPAMALFLMRSLRYGPKKTLRTLVEGLRGGMPILPRDAISRLRRAVR